MNGNYQDSAGYSLPYNPGQVQLNSVLKSSADLDINKYSGYVQDNILLGDSSHAAHAYGRRPFQLQFVEQGISFFSALRRQSGNRLE